MKTINRLKLVFSSLLVLALTIQISVAQTYNLSNNASSLIVDGTSNLHDWDVKAANQSGKLAITLDGSKVAKIDQLDFSVVAESLKSGKSGMDKNTYKALNTGKHKNITFKMTNVKKLDCADSGNCKVTVTGNLSIAGKSKSVDLNFDMKVTDSKITLNGSRKLKMTEFGVEPPTAMFGTITTGDDIVVKFQSTFTK